MDSEIVNTHTLFHHYIRELEKAKEAIAQTDKYLSPSSPHYLIRYIENLENLQLSGQDQTEKITRAKANLKAYEKRAGLAQIIVNDYPKKLAYLTDSNDIFLAPPSKQNECLYILDRETCAASCNSIDDVEEGGESTTLFSDKTDIKLEHKHQTDAVRVWSHNVVVSNLHIADLRCYNDAHRDAIQLIPPALHKTIHGKQRRIGDQLAGTILNNVSIQGCKIEAPHGPLQGIFASDGMHRNLKIIDNDIKTLGSHTISIAGLLTGGVITGNKLRKIQSGAMPEIRLYPARIGGNMAEDGVLTLLSFATEKNSDSIGYGAVDIGMSGNKVILENGSFVSLDIMDLRREVPKSIEHMCLGLTNFHYYAYLEEFSNTTYSQYVKSDPVGVDQLQAWLSLRSDEYIKGRPIGHVLGQPSQEQRNIAVNNLVPALEALSNGELDGTYISEIRQTAIRSFLMKRIAIKHGELAPFKDLGEKNKRRELILRFLLA